MKGNNSNEVARSKCQSIWFSL